MSENIQNLIDTINEKDRYSFSDLLDIMKILRSPQGCPWDREQTNKSVRNAIIDEAYEFIEGLDNDDNKLMCEELGDVLLQIVFHCRIKEELGDFTTEDVIDGVCKKMVLRHPHVFGNTSVENSEDVLVKWEQIKNVEKSRKTPYEQLSSVAVSLPSLMRAQKLQSKSEKVGLSEKKTSEQYIAELENSLKTVKENSDKKALSEVLFAAVGACRTLGYDAEELLYSENNAYLKKFK